MAVNVHVMIVVIVGQTVELLYLTSLADGYHELLKT